MRKVRLRLVLLCAILLASLPLTSSVGAASYTVTTLSDAPAHSGVSLRDAIASAASGTDMIAFQSGLTGTITLEQGSLMLAHSVTIVGPGVMTIAVDANSASRVLDVAAGITVSLTGLTIQHGTSDQGAGIQTQGTLTLTNCVVRDNEGVTIGFSQPRGVGIVNTGVLTIVDSTVSGNHSSALGSAGGGIFHYPGSTTGTTLSVLRSTISGNQLSGVGTNGGGIYSNGGAMILNSTIANNEVGQFGGGIAGRDIAVINSTVSGNIAPFGGPGIFVYSPPAVTLTATIVAGNQTGARPSQDIQGTVVSGGHNVIGESAGPQGFGATDLVNVDPRLGPLASNGGPTQTMALLAGSPAIDAAGASCPPGIATDQRGLARPQGAGCDIGAFEVVVANALPNPHPSGSPSGPVDPLPGLRPSVSPGGPPAPLPPSRSLAPGRGGTSAPTSLATSATPAPAPPAR